MSVKETITFADAVRIAGPAAFNIMLKPAGSLCNLDCRYCYYLDKSEIYGGREPRMSEEMLEIVIREYIKANDIAEVMFNWHGGEPLVLGLDFYKKAVELERKYGPEKKILNTIQTNGTLVTQEWADFFAENNFLVGISLDGPEDVHDKYRKDKAGLPTFEKVMRGLDILKRTEVQFNTLSTVNKASEGRGLETYQFLKSVGSRFMQFMPVVEHIKLRPDAARALEGRTGLWKVEDGTGQGEGAQPRIVDQSWKGARPRIVDQSWEGARPRIVDPSEEGAKIAPWSVGDIAFGRFLCDIFDYWVRNDVGQYFVSEFDATLANWCGAQPGTCVFAETCGGNAVIEHNGDLYPCDHFVYPKYKLGNIAKESIKDMMAGQAQVSFGIDKRNTLPRKCLRCEYLFACHGECPKHRFSRTESGETGLNALCAGYYKFFRHVAPFMDRMRDLLAHGQSPAAIIPWAGMQQ